MNKKLMCPICGARIVDASEYTISELRVVEEKELKWVADYYQKCKKCKKEIGIKKLNK